MIMLDKSLGKAPLGACAPSTHSEKARQSLASQAEAHTSALELVAFGLQLADFAAELPLGFFCRDPVE